MKLASAAALATAATVAAAPQSTLERRQGGFCFVFARGSTEPSPLGLLIGPSLQRGLQTRLPGLKTYPVLYAARIETNISAQRTDQASINKGVEAFKQAQGCRVIVAGGYSQGAAVMHNVVGKALDASLKSKIAGVALFGDTRNKQDGGHIPNFPQQKSRVWCNKNDGVCGGGLSVNAGHLSYSNTQITEAATWLAGLAKNGGGSSGGEVSEDGGSEEAAPAAPKGKGKGMGGKGMGGKGGKGKGKAGR